MLLSYLAWHYFILLFFSVVKFVGQINHSHLCDAEPDCTAEIGGYASRRSSPEVPADVPALAPVSAAAASVASAAMLPGPAASASSVNYFYGRISRDEAESILRRNGCQEGLYLLRENVSIPGNFALSICHQNRSASLAYCGSTTCCCIFIVLMFLWLSLYYNCFDVIAIICYIFNTRCCCYVVHFFIVSLCKI